MDKTALANVEWVDSTEQLFEITKTLAQAKVLAIDTEFERRTTYFPIFALLQVFDGKTIYLIDVTQLDCSDEFRAIFSNENIVKIMHSSKEDLEVLFTAWNCKVNNLFDTQVAHNFLTGNLSIGYASIVAEICGETLGKEATQSDWLARPLSQMQLDYAAKDVVFLPEIYKSFKQKIKQQPFFKLFQQECQSLCLGVLVKPDYEKDYRQAGDVNRLSAEQLGIFKHFYQWREETAIKENRTRNHIVKDFQMVQIILTMPKKINDLKKIEKLHPRSIRVYGEAMLDLIHNQNNIQALETVPNPRDVKGLSLLEKDFYQVAKNIAQLHNLSMTSLISKRLVKKIAYAYITKESFPELWQGWRGDLLKSEFDIKFSQLKAANAF